jgi:bifunctional DNA-binding transcriptional regulator/antitoxin component of YhaV-PrlF toxin-antitoxin module
VIRVSCLQLTGASGKWVLPFCPHVVILFAEVYRMLVQTDTRRRITLPPSTGIKPGDALEVELLDDGRIVLIPVEPVPRHQLWAWSPESKQAIISSLADPRASVVVETGEQAACVADRWSHED